MLKVVPRNTVPDNPDQPVPLDFSEAAAESPELRSGPLFGLDAGGLATVLKREGEPAWRGEQIAEAIYHQYITELSSITTLPLALRQKLEGEGWRIGRPEIAKVFQSADGTERYLVECAGAKPETVETVWMPEGDDGEAGDGSEEEQAGEGQPDAKTWRRATVCVSSQVGCAVNCQFCLTARLGLKRNLTAGEIAGQVVAVFDRHNVRVGRDRVNLVFMGMGEPFLNYNNFMAAVRLLVREVGLSPQRMTVSTSGIVPGIERFVQEPGEVRPKLAISLNAPNDEVRAEVMPINRKWPIAAVVDAVRPMRLRPHERITFEYVLLGGVTDRPEQARELARLVRRTGLPAKVNLIAWNPGPDFNYSTPKAETAEQFRYALAGEGIPAYIRQPRGRDIFAACGQLKRTLEA
ncbi:MAG TPA: 23S rRNA (adenine(2503)-C(2))-methyltransferase RlmN [Terracidiphilus sp.]|nr:23S rRNA (adenine(2503)-C(2))-methyltransferase RlmN [Terracidiphilus sp.]